MRNIKSVLRKSVHDPPGQRGSSRLEQEASRGIALLAEGYRAFVSASALSLSYVRVSEISLHYYATRNKLRTGTVTDV